MRRLAGNVFILLYVLLFLSVLPAGADTNMVIPSGFDYAGSFTCGLAEARKGDRHGYIDRSGRFVWETREPEGMR